MDQWERPLEVMWDERLSHQCSSMAIYTHFTFYSFIFFCFVFIFRQRFTRFTFSFFRNNLKTKKQKQQLLKQLHHMNDSFNTVSNTKILHALGTAHGWRKHQQLPPIAACPLASGVIWPNKSWLYTRSTGGHWIDQLVKDLKDPDYCYTPLFINYFFTFHLIF